MPGQRPHIDDLLVRRHALALRVRHLLAGRDLDGLSLRDYRALLDTVRRLPADVRVVLGQLVQVLPPAQAELAAELLSDLDDLAQPRLAPPSGGARVLSIDGSGETVAPAAPPPIDLLMQSAADPAGTPEELGLLWLERFFNCPAAERLPILRDLLLAARGRCGPVMRLEWLAGDLAGDARLAEIGERHFGRWPAPWVQFPRGEGPGPDGLPPLPLERLESWMASVEGTGHMALIIARPDPAERYTFAVVLLDLWERGIEDAWGNAKAEAAALAGVLGHFASLQPDVTWRRLESRHAAGVIQQARRLNDVNCHLVPPEFWVWADLCATPGQMPVTRRLRRP